MLALFLIRKNIQSNILGLISANKKLLLKHYFLSSLLNIEKIKTNTL